MNPVYKFYMPISVAVALETDKFALEQVNVTASSVAIKLKNQCFFPIHGKSADM